MDIDMVSPLSVEECQKRLDEAIVQYSVQVPLWNWPPRKMAGSRTGFGFILDPRSFQFTTGGKTNIRPVKIPFVGTLSAINSGTQIQGNFDTEAFQNSRIMGTAFLLVFTIVVCIMTGISWSQYAIPSFNWLIADILTCLSAVMIAITIYFWRKLGSQPNPPYRKKVTKFLRTVLEATEATTQ